MLPLSSLKSIQQVQTPAWLKVTAYTLLFLIFVGFLMVGFVPWQQTVMGSGRITSFSPNNRPQQIESPIKGRIKKWYVREGQHVKAGQLIVELQDLDKEFLPPDLIALTENSRDAIGQNRQSYILKAQAIDSSIANLRLNLRESLDAGRQAVSVAKGELQTAKLNLERTQVLSDKGLASERDKELAIQAKVKAEGDLQRAEIELQRISSKTQADITKLESEKASSLAEAAKAGDELAKTSVKLGTAQKRAELAQIKAPTDGTIVKLLKRGPGETFKENEQIAVITPQTLDQAVELYVSDIDAPLISPGNEVRLQFSGWPALQFAGLSKSVRLGTFSGMVAVVDNVDSGNGKYRILVVPDFSEGDWPSAKYLRPGTRVAGWVILKTVPLGYELWRRFNGFPIALTDVQGYDDTDYTSGNSIGKEDKETSVIYKKRKK
jgi:membrane fusion protein, adhesin transport system